MSSSGVPPHSGDTGTQQPVSSTGDPPQADESGAPATRKRKKRSTKDSYNYCKSNSLGILSVAEAHRHLGPAILHWEGGWAGERKIQPAKAQLGIKRVNADWRKLVLQTLWRDDALSGLIEKLNKDASVQNQRREMEGQLRIYSNRDAVIEAINSCKPLSAILHEDGSVWMAYRPTTNEYRGDNYKETLHDWSRSALQLLKLHFDDDSGMLLSYLCWFAPLSVADGDIITLGKPQELNSIVNQFVLLLPQLGAGDEYQNMFYAIGSKWSERVRGGSFEQPKLPKEIFEDWQTTGTYS